MVHIENVLWREDLLVLPPKYRWLLQLLILLELALCFLLDLELHIVNIDSRVVHGSSMPKVRYPIPKTVDNGRSK